MLSIVKLLDVKGEPKAKLDLPILRLGDPIQLRFRLERMTQGRSEVLEVNGRFRVSQVGFDHASSPPRQLLALECAERPPAWRAVRKRPTEKRRLSPAVFPRTAI